MNRKNVPIVGFCAWSGTGKTTLITQLLPILKEQGLKIAVVKHAHHNFDIDHPGKDSFRLREAGASQMLITSRKRMAIISEFDEDRAEPSLSDALERLDMKKLDLVLVEGFKHESYPKIELHRSELNKDLMFPDDPDIIAIASDGVIIENAHNLSKLDINNPSHIARFIIDNILVKTPAITATEVSQP